LSGKIHVIGAGLSGLSAAVWLLKAGRSVAVYEAAGHAGGRCRSYFDENLGRLIDNGNHLILSGNRAVYQFMDAIGTEDRLCGPERAEFEFVDLRDGARWTVRPGAGRVPWWILFKDRRVPGSRLIDYIRALGLAWANGEETVSGCLGKQGALFEKFWEPLAVSALNTHADEAAASLLWPVVGETFGRGEAACRPRIARKGLSDCFIEPSLNFLAKQSTHVRFGQRLRCFESTEDKITALHFSGDHVIELDRDDSVILAVPHGAAIKAAPWMQAPRGSRAIVNGHFLLSQALDHPRILGMVGGTCHWLFVRDDVASVTVSAADVLARDDPQEIATRMWDEIAQVMGLEGAPLPAYRIVKEKRATFAQTPEEVARRPGVRTIRPNLFLAGDWTDTGLPATIEGSLRSGRKAAETLLATATSP